MRESCAESRDYIDAEPKCVGSSESEFAGDTSIRYADCIFIRKKFSYSSNVIESLRKFFVSVVVSFRDWKIKCNGFAVVVQVVLRFTS